MTALVIVPPIVISVDPESLDATRPVDVDVCPHCIDGTVQVQTGDPYPGAWDGEPCWACGGTGVRGAV